MNLKVAVVDDEAPIRQWLTYCIGTIAPEDKISTAANGAGGSGDDGAGPAGYCVH